MGELAQDSGLDAWAVAWAVSIRDGDALLFATDVLGFLVPGQPNPVNPITKQPDLPQLEPWQVVALRKFSKAWRNRFTKPGRISIRSGHGVGKTVYLCIITLFTMFAGGPDTKIPIISSSEKQLVDGMWPEAAKWINRLPEPLRAQVDWQAKKIAMKCAPQECFATQRTASKHKPEALAGIHARTVLAIFEEASGVPEETHETSLGALSTPGAIAVAVGNPTRSSGFFYKTHCDPHVMVGWDRMVVNSEDVPRARGHVNDVVKEYGRDSNRYRVRVLGEFPTQDDDVVIPLELALRAKGRPVIRSSVWPVWGLDVARFGDDRTVLVRRQGNTLIHAPTIWRNMDGVQVAGVVLREWDLTPLDLKPKEICIDVIGYGSSVVDQLSRDGSPVKNIITSVNVAESASADPANNRLRDELWWKGRQWFQNMDCAIPADLWDTDQGATSESAERIEQLIAELTTVTYDISEAGKRVVESKKDMKRDGKRSPDLADGFLLTFAAGVYPRGNDVHRSRWIDPINTDPWSA